MTQKTISANERPHPAATAPHDGQYLRVLVQFIEEGDGWYSAARLLDTGQIGWTIGYNDHDLVRETDDPEDAWRVVGREWNAGEFVDWKHVRVLGWLPAPWLNQGYNHLTTDAVLAWIAGGDEPPEELPDEAAA